MGDILSGGIRALLDLLPDDPFSAALDSLAGNSAVTGLLGMVNWFIPFYLFIPVLLGWLSC